MRATREIIFGFALMLLTWLPGAAFGQDRQPVQFIKETTARRASMALSYPEGTTISMKFRGTQRLPRSSGEAKVQRKKGMTEIEVELDEMKPAAFFGGDFNTYVLWSVSPEGHLDNLGEFILQGNRSKLNVSTPLDTFGLFITAEPHFLVSAPSRFVVMENTRPAQNLGNPIHISQIEYRGFGGVYNFERETLANVRETKGETRSDLEQARISVQLAERSGAKEFAAEEFGRAQTALQKTEAAVRSGVDKRNVMLIGKETVRLASSAQKLAEDRSFQAALDAERQRTAEETARLERGLSEAKTEAERQRLRAEQREIQLAMEERARRAAATRAEDAARRAAEEARRRRAAEARARKSAQQAERAAVEAERAAVEAERAGREREAARARMQQALGLVAETRESARGLIVNLPDILFDTGRARLRPQAREVISRIAGILLVARGFRLKIEGHTDNVGSDEYNRKLSEKRAQAVQDYLVEAGVSPDIITTEGFGESRPLNENRTRADRQKNRRVEIIIEDTGKLKL